MKMPPFSFILVRPQLGENIGAAARVMKNFGFTDLRIVAPRDGWPNPAAESMAAGGLDLLQSAVLYDSTREAVADLNTLYATTARPRDMEKECITSHELTEHARARAAGVVEREAIATASPPEQNQAQKTGILFGPERSGLENEDIVLADCIVSVPVQPEYPSLNLAQTVALMVYECSKIAQIGGQQTDPLVREALRPIVKDSSPQRGQASKEELNGFFDHLETELDARNFWKVIEKKPQMWINIRNLFTRASPTEQEIRTLRGIIRSLSER